MVTLFIIYELNTWWRDPNTDFALSGCLFGAMKLTKNADPSKHRYCGYVIRFGARLQFSLAIAEWGKNVFISGVVNSSTRIIDNRKKTSLFLMKNWLDWISWYGW